MSSESRGSRSRESSSFKPPPTLWIVLVAGILLVSTSLLHFSSLGATPHTSPNKNYEDKVLHLREYTEKLESKISEIESSKMHKVVTAIQEEFKTIKSFVKHEADLVTNVVFHQEPESLQNTSIVSNIVANSWQERLVSKLHCLHQGRGGLFLYHTRKAAGTTVRDVLALIAHKWRVKVFESEGNSLDARFMHDTQLFTVLTLREPVERAMSLYWYEHVGWWHGILQQTEKCKPLRVWVDAWRDGSDWKSNFIRKNPSTVYVEIENYYVKMLTGWRGPEPVGPDDLEHAKRVLEQFDLILLVEWMQDDTQVTALNALFPGRSSIAPGNKLKGDASMKAKLKQRMAPDEESVLKDLAGMNSLDSQLWEFAQSMVAVRLKEVVDLTKQADKLDILSKTHALDHKFKCSAHSYRLPGPLASHVGVFRPVGHKGPLP